MNVNCPSCEKVLSIPPGHEAGPLICPLCRAQFNAAPPGSVVSGPGPGPQLEAEVSRQTIEAMRNTRSWVLFIAVLGVIGAGLTVVGALGILVVSREPGGPPASLSLVYVVGAVFHLIPAVMLFKYASAISTLVLIPSMHTLDRAVNAQQSYWRTLGILIIMGIILGIIAVAVIAVLSVQMAAQSPRPIRPAW